MVSLTIFGRSLICFSLILFATGLTIVSYEIEIYDNNFNNMNKTIFLSGIVSTIPFYIGATTSDNNREELVSPV